MQQPRSPLQKSSSSGAEQFTKNNISILSVTLLVTIILGKRHTGVVGPVKLVGLRNSVEMLSSGLMLPSLKTAQHYDKFRLSDSDRAEWLAQETYYQRQICTPNLNLTHPNTSVIGSYDVGDSNGEAFAVCFTVS